jgi:hypothetical protein
MLAARTITTAKFSMLSSVQDGVQTTPQPRIVAFGGSMNALKKSIMNWRAAAAAVSSLHGLPVTNDGRLPTT